MGPNREAYAIEKETEKNYTESSEVKKKKTSERRKEKLKKSVYYDRVENG